MYYIIYVHYIYVYCGMRIWRDDVCAFPTYASPPTLHRSYYSTHAPATLHRRARVRALTRCARGARV